MSTQEEAARERIKKAELARQEARERIKKQDLARLATDPVALAWKKHNEETVPADPRANVPIITQPLTQPVEDSIAATPVLGVSNFSYESSVLKAMNERNREFWKRRP